MEPPSTDEFQFRLFSKKSSSVPVAQRIVLRSPTPTNQNPGFLVPSRPDSYYFTNGSSIEKIQQYQQAAVTGADIVKGLNGIWVCHVGYVFVKMVELTIYVSMALDYRGELRPFNFQGRVSCLIHGRP